jgi:hypothetical protein
LPNGSESWRKPTIYFEFILGDISPDNFNLIYCAVSEKSICEIRKMQLFVTTSCPDQKWRSIIFYMSRTGWRSSIRIVNFMSLFSLVCQKIKKKSLKLYMSYLQTGSKYFKTFWRFFRNLYCLQQLLSASQYFYKWARYKALKNENLKCFF